MSWAFSQRRFIAGSAAFIGAGYNPLRRQNHFRQHLMPSGERGGQRPAWRQPPSPYPLGN